MLMKMKGFIKCTAGKIEMFPAEEYLSVALDGRCGGREKSRRALLLPIEFFENSAASVLAAVVPGKVTTVHSDINACW